MAIEVERIIDSKIEDNPIGSGEFYEKYISLTEGRYQVSTFPEDEDRIGELHVAIFNEHGKRIASDEGNLLPLPGFCGFTVSSGSINLKVKVTRSESENPEKIHYVVSLEKRSLFN